MNEEKILRMVPVDLDKQGEARDPKLAAAVQAFAEKELGVKITLAFYYRLWAILLVKPSDPDHYCVIGLTSLRFVPDCSLFHIVPPTADREGMKIAMQARDLAVYRLHSYLEDQGHRGGNVLIYVSQGAQKLWRNFLTKIKAKPSDRFEMEI